MEWWTRIGVDSRVVISESARLTSKSLFSGSPKSLRVSVRCQGTVHAVADAREGHIVRAYVDAEHVDSTDAIVYALRRLAATWSKTHR